ncbi:hypothetical protein [Shewanella sp.]
MQNDTACRSIGAVANVFAVVWSILCSGGAINSAVCCESAYAFNEGKG